MFAPLHPETLASDWIAPEPLHRSEEVDRAVRSLVESRAASTVPALSIAGPDGAGASTVARQAIRRYSELSARGDGRPARLLLAKARGIRGTATLSAQLLRQFDPGFVARGFPTAEIVAGLLRRLKREGRPTVVLLDDLDVGGPAVEPILSALESAESFLPEGGDGLPSITVVIAGRLRAVDRLVVGLRPRAPRLVLAPLTPEQVATIVRDRATRALGREPPPGFAERIVARASAEGGSAHRAIDLLRRELLGPGANHPASVFRTGPSPEPQAVERHLVRALIDAAGRAPAAFAEVRASEERIARNEGRRPMRSTTLWRRILRLEQTGYLLREIRLGGPGGTQSVIRLLVEPADWLTAPRPDILRASSPIAYGAARGTAPTLAAR